MTSRGENLIFLISQPRAGSTLLQRVLAGHPDVFATAEPWIMLHPLYALKKSGHSAEYDAHLAREALSDFCENIDGGVDTYFEAVRAFAATLYGSALRPTGKGRFLDKTPRYYFIASELREVFPKAKFIFLLRNPLAVLASILETWVKQDWPALRSYQADLLEAPRLMAQAVRQFQSDGIVIRYEELVSNPETTIRNLSARLDLQFNPAMLEYGANPKPKGRMGDPVGVHQFTRPVTESLNKWTRSLAGPQERFLATNYLTALGPALLREIGYSEPDLRRELQALPSLQINLPSDWEQWANNFFGIQPPLKRRAVEAECRARKAADALFRTSFASPAAAHSAV